MLHEIRKLGSGNYGSVMLVEVENHPELKMAVKVCGLFVSMIIKYIFFSFVNSD